MTFRCHRLEWERSMPLMRVTCSELYYISSWRVPLHRLGKSAHSPAKTFTARPAPAVHGQVTSWAERNWGITEGNKHNLLLSSGIFLRIVASVEAHECSFYIVMYEKPSVWREGWFVAILFISLLSVCITIWAERNGKKCMFWSSHMAGMCWQVLRFGLSLWNTIKRNIRVSSSVLS